MFTIRGNYLRPGGSPRPAGFSSEGESQRSGEPEAMNDRERRYACRVGRLFSTERRMFICGGRGRTHRRCGPLRRATQRVAGWGGRKQILRRYAPQNDRGRRGARNDKERREDRCAMAGGVTKDGIRNDEGKEPVFECRMAATCHVWKS